MKTATLSLASLLLAVGLLQAAPAAQAQVSVGVGVQLDARHHHDHYYPAPGYVVHGPPAGAVAVAWRGGNYFYHGGVWYRPYGASWRVFVPPVGIVVPLLPPAYVTLNFGGLPYYYANGVYYTGVVGGGGYTVVAPPPGIEAVTPVAPVVVAPPPPARPNPIIYPRNGQSAAQTEADRQDCNRWATGQPAAMNDASVFNRAVEACMDGRGYTMR